MKIISTKSVRARPRVKIEVKAPHYIAADPFICPVTEWILLTTSTALTNLPDAPIKCFSACRLKRFLLTQWDLLCFRKESFWSWLWRFDQLSFKFLKLTSFARNLLTVLWKNYACFQKILPTYLLLWRFYVFLLNGIADGGISLVTRDTKTTHSNKLLPMKFVTRNLDRCKNVINCVR